MEDIKYCNVKYIAKMLGCSTRTIDRLVESGQFPQPLKLGKLKRWNVSVVSEFLSSLTLKPKNN